MDNKDNTQINNTAETAQPITPGGVNKGANQVTSEKLDGDVPPKKNNKLFLLITGLVLVLAVIIILMISSGMLNKSAKPVPTPQAQQIITPTPSDQNQEIVSQEPITSQQGVISVLQQVENSNPDIVGADLSKNTADASSFSQ